MTTKLFITIPHLHIMPWLRMTDLVRSPSLASVENDTICLKTYI